MSYAIPEIEPINIIGTPFGFMLEDSYKDYLKTVEDIANYYEGLAVANKLSNLNTILFDKVHIENWEAIISKRNYCIRVFKTPSTYFGFDILTKLKLSARFMTGLRKINFENHLGAFIQSNKDFLNTKENLKIIDFDINRDFNPVNLEEHYNLQLKIYLKSDLSLEAVKNIEENISKDIIMELSKKFENMLNMVVE